MSWPSPCCRAGGRVLSAGGGLWRANQFTTNYDHVLRLWDLKTGEVLKTLEGHEVPVWDLAVSADGTRALSGSGGWAVENGQQAVGADGRPVPFGYGVLLWDLEQGDKVRAFEGHESWVRAVRFFPGDRRAVSGSWDHTVRIWDLETGEEVRRLEGHTAGVDCVDVSPDGRLILSGGGMPGGQPTDADIRLWDAETGDLVHTLKGHTQRVWGVAFSPDGRRALSGSSDTTVRLWDLETGKEVHKFEGHTDQVRRVIFTHDGRRALWAGHDKTVRVWELPE